MTTDLRHADLPYLMREAADLGRLAEQQFGGLTSQQLNWRPNSDEWSVGQCFDHLIVATTTYFPAFGDIQAGTKRSTVWERLPLLPSLFGPWLIQLLSPERSRKVRAPAVFRPTESALDPQIIRTFAAIQQELVRFMAGTAPRDLDRIVTSPAARFLARQCENALAVAQYLSGRSDVMSVRYPGLPNDPAYTVASRQMQRFGPVVSFVIATRARAEAFLRACQLVYEATSFGAVHTSAERRARWGGDAIPEGFIRLSVGCEAATDLLVDLAQALDKAATA